MATGQKVFAFIDPLAKCLILLFFTALLTGSTSASQPASPRATTAVLEVTTTTDELLSPGTGCSLREAITNANDDASTYAECYQSGTYGDDAIVLPPETYILNIGATGEDVNIDGDLDILDSGNLTIEGAGAIIDGNNAERVFHICPITLCEIEVFLDSVTIQNGSADLGGGIYSRAHTTIKGGKIISNTATDRGGGICNDNITIVDSSIIISNTATNFGGGIYNVDSTTVDASTVISNRAYHGGGIFNDGGSLTVQGDSTIGEAGAPNTAYSGGGIYNTDDGTTNLDFSTVSSNSAEAEGGGISSASGAVNVFSSTINDNVANFGGGIRTSAGVMANVYFSEVSNNTANYSGGGIYNQGSLYVAYGVIGGDGTPNTANEGGGIYNVGGTTTITQSRILYNTAASSGSGIYNSVDVIDAVNMTGSCIVGNSPLTAGSFYNAQGAQQTATGNWWGVASGPDTPYADTTYGNVDTSGFLTTPILGCPNSYPEHIYLPLVLSQ